MSFAVRCPLSLRLALAATALLASSHASAYLVSECQQTISVTRQFTLGAELGDKDRAGLVGKLDSASLKLDQIKLPDALQNLTDYKAKLQALAFAPKPKLPATDFTTLDGSVDAAITCVNGLIQQG